MIASLQAHQFQSHVTNPSFHQPVLLKVFGPNCGPCRSLAPLLHQLDAQYPGLAIVAMDASSAPSLVQEFGIQTVPTLLVFRSGTVVARHDGSPGTIGALQQFVAPHLS